MSSLQRYHNVVDGKPRPSATGRWLASTNPFTGADWAEVPRCGVDDVNAAVESAHAAFHKGPWATCSATARGKALRRLGDLIARDAEKLAAIEVRDNGKLFAEMAGQLRYVPEWFYYFGGLADKVEGGVLPADKPNLFCYTKREPLGVVVAITPWNSPLLLLAWKLAPALAAGNTVVIKPSEFTSCSTLAFMELVKEAGFPDGVVNTVTGLGSEIGPALVEHPLVAKVAFTGGDATGAAVYAAAAKSIKHVTLELGGKSPNIIFADARIDDAVKGAISGIFAASGQTCIAGSRLLVQRSVYDEVSSKVVQLARSAQLGDPMLATTQVGPITTKAQREKVLGYIDIATSEGARCLLGGGVPAAAELSRGMMTLLASAGPADVAGRIVGDHMIRLLEQTLSNADAGRGSVGRTACLLSRSAIDVTSAGLACRGTGTVTNDLVGGQFDDLCDQVINVAPKARSGTIRTLAAAQPKTATGRAAPHVVGTGGLS